MVNLVKRHLIVQKWQIYTFIPFVLVFVLSNVPPILIFLVVSIFIPYNALTYDERAETDKLLNSLPYTRKEIIASRYMGAIVYMIFSLVITSFLLHLFQKPFTFVDLVMGAGLFLVFVALTFPVYVFIKQGNITLFILIGLILSVWLVRPTVAFMTTNYPELITVITTISKSSMYIIGSIFVMLLYCLSWWLSLYLYERKVL